MKSIEFQIPFKTIRILITTLEWYCILRELMKRLSGMNFWLNRSLGTALIRNLFFQFRLSPIKEMKFLMSSLFLECCIYISFALLLLN